MSAIRLIGQHHTTHHDGTVLQIAEEHVVKTNSNVVTLDYARDLVANGDAEWVGDVPRDSHDDAAVTAAPAVSDVPKGAA